MTDERVTHPHLEGLIRKWRNTASANRRKSFRTVAEVEMCNTLDDCADELEAALAALPGGGVALIAAERQRQMAVEGWTPEHDSEHAAGELAVAAACYAAPEVCNSDGETGTRPRMAILAHWPWALSWWKPGDRIRELTKAGALIAAEIDRLQAAPTQPPHEADHNG